MRKNAVSGQRKRHGRRIGETTTDKSLYDLRKGGRSGHSDGGKRDRIDGLSKSLRSSPRIAPAAAAVMIRIISILSVVAANAEAVTSAVSPEAERPTFRARSKKTRPGNLRTTTSDSADPS